MDTKLNEITFYQLSSEIENYNKNHAIKIEYGKVNDVGYHTLKIGLSETGPMTYGELFYFLKGFRYKAEMI